MANLKFIAGLLFSGASFSTATTLAVIGRCVEFVRKFTIWIYYFFVVRTAQASDLSLRCARESILMNGDFK